MFNTQVSTWITIIWNHHNGQVSQLSKSLSLSKTNDGSFSSDFLPNVWETWRCLVRLAFSSGHTGGGWPVCHLKIQNCQFNYDVTFQIILVIRIQFLYIHADGRVLCECVIRRENLCLSFVAPSSPLMSLDKRWQCSPFCYQNNENKAKVGLKHT